MLDKKDHNHTNSNEVISENKLILIRNPLVCLILIGVVGLVIRIYSYPYDLPVYQDISDYFWYAMDMSVLGEFPQMAKSQALVGVPPYQDIVFQIMVGRYFFPCFFLWQTLKIF